LTLILSSLACTVVGGSFVSVSKAIVVDVESFEDFKGKGLPLATKTMARTRKLKICNEKSNRKLN